MFIQKKLTEIHLEDCLMYSTAEGKRTPLGIKVVLGM